MGLNFGSMGERNKSRKNKVSLALKKSQPLVFLTILFAG